MDQNVRELFKSTLVKIKSEHRDLQKCVDKVLDDKNIFQSWEDVNSSKISLAITKLNNDIASNLSEKIGEDLSNTDQEFYSSSADSSDFDLNPAGESAQQADLRSIDYIAG
jgi:transcription initiation factor IIE alpha subunit